MGGIFSREDKLSQVKKTYLEHGHHCRVKDLILLRLSRKPTEVDTDP